MREMSSSHALIQRKTYQAFLRGILLIVMMFLPFGRVFGRKKVLNTTKEVLNTGFDRFCALARLQDASDASKCSDTREKHYFTRHFRNNSAQTSPFGSILSVRLV